MKVQNLLIMIIFTFTIAELKFSHFLWSVR